MPKNWKDILILDWRGSRLKNLYFDTPDAEGIFFEYNADGIRTEKTYAERAGEVPVYTDVYTVDGSKILSEQRTDEETGNVIRTIYYVYDANGQPVGMKYNGVQYWYQKNMQGDVVRILNASGAEVVSYAYDAWGKVLSVSGSLSSTVGAANPFRYRGYYYDTETGWYYLNTRYYDPNVGRFLSPDTILGANGGLLGYNLYAYCNNNPVMFADPSGNLYLPNTKFEATPVCPDNIMAQILNSGLDATTEKYGGEHKEGKYMVYMFNDLEIYVRRSFFGWFKSLAVEGSIAYYYFEMSDNRSKYQYYMKAVKNLNRISKVLDVSNGGGPFVDTPGFPVVAVAMNVLGVAQLGVNKIRDNMWEKAQYYRFKPDEYELKYVIVEYYIGSIKQYEEKIYA